MHAFVLLLALLASSLAIVLPRQTPDFCASYATPFCCGSLDLIDEPSIANFLALEGDPIPVPATGFTQDPNAPLVYYTVGLNCSTVVGSTTEALQASCLGILSCCEFLASANNDVAWFCEQMATDSTNSFR